MPVDELIPRWSSIPRNHSDLLGFPLAMSVLWMTTKPRSILHLAGALLLLAAAGCAREPAAPPESYRVRGMVRQLPVPDAARGDVLIRHEAIPSFKNADGEVVGMDSMSMPFPLADVALAAGIEVGDRIEMYFEVDWQGGNPLKVTAIEKLPEGTRLAFEAAETEPDAEAPAAAEPEVKGPGASPGE